MYWFLNINIYSKFPLFLDCAIITSDNSLFKNDIWLPQAFFLLHGGCLLKESKAA